MARSPVSSRAVNQSRHASFTAEGRALTISPNTPVSSTMTRFMETVAAPITGPRRELAQPPPRQVPPVAGFPLHLPPSRNGVAESNPDYARCLPCGGLHALMRLAPFDCLQSFGPTPGAVPAPEA